MNDDGTYSLDWDEVHRHGYMDLGCGDCAEVIYRGRMLPDGQAVALIEAHNLVCVKPLSSMPKRRRLPRWADFVAGFRSRE